MSQIDKLLAVARAQIGVKESPPGSNTVKYNTAYYGKAVSGAAYPWCMAHVWWCFREAGLSHLFYGGKKTASCAELLDFAKKNTQFVAPRELRPGDVVLYKFNTNARAANHVGIVTAVSGVKITAIEGNTSITSDDNGGAVMERVRDYTYIVGGFRPNYEENDDMTDEQFEQMYNAMMERRGKLPPRYSGATGTEYEAAIAAGITDGSRPQALATREEVALMAARAAGRKD